MAPHRHIARLIIAAIALTFPVAATACDWLFIPISGLYADASDVFVGKVVESPWKKGPDGEVVVTGNRSLRFSVERRFRGAETSEIALDVSLSCGYPFLQDERYLVHATRVNGILEANYASRPMLLADAAEALKYLEAKAARRPIALLQGHINLKDRDGKHAWITSGTTLTVRLENSSGRFEIKTAYNPFEIVAPPGEYALWLEIGGKPVSERKTVRLLEESRTNSTEIDGTIP
jgi:hypothetical protein